MSTLASSLRQVMSITLWGMIWVLTCSSHWGCQDDTRDTLQEPTPNEESVQFQLNTWGEQLAELQKIQETLVDSSDQLDLQKSRYVALRQLEQLSLRLPTIASIIQLKRAEIWASLGRWRQSTEIINSLSIDETELQLEAGRMLISYASKCEDLEEGIEVLSQQQSDPALEKIIAKARVTYTAQCKSKLSYERALLKLAEIDPHQLSSKELINLSTRKTPEEVIRLAQVWERARLPKVSVHVLGLLLQRKSLTKPVRWDAQFHKERISIERLRDGFKQSARQLQELIKVSGERGRRARLLLGKAWSKLDKIKKAQQVYQELIKEWKFSEESKEARFLSAFLYYEQGQYREALKGFAELCRHKGKLKALKRFPDRAPKSAKMVGNAEWYYAWSLYLTKPRHAAPFLEALIGRGLPTSEEGRRAAYWASKSLARDQPDRAAQYRAQLLAGHWGDWYALLLRAEDPELSSDIKPWPALPDLNPPARPPLPVIYQHEIQTSKLNALSKTNITSQMTLIESLAARIEVAQTLRFSQLGSSYKKKARAELNVQLRSLQNIEPDLIAWGQTLGFHRDLLRWALAHSFKRRKQPPKINEATWWMLLYPRAFAQAVQSASMEAGVAQIKLLSFIYKESAFDTEAISPAYAMGLMQLLEKTARALHPKAPPPNLLNPQENVQLGAEYISLLSNRFHDQLPLIAASYNAGPTSVISWIERGQKKIKSANLIAL
jgi:soluble lytic murein transglycosylase-like protein